MTDRNWWEHPVVLASSFFCCIPIPLALAVLSPRASVRLRVGSSAALGVWALAMAFLVPGS